MNDEYTKYFEHFHKERLSFLSGKDKHKKCKGCETDKVLTEKDNELTFNCGSTNEDKECGDQFKIELPIYINYYEEKQRLTHLIHGSPEYNPDIEDLSVYNLEKLHKYLKVDKEYSEQQKIISDSSDKLKELNQQYREENKLDTKFKQIQDLYVIKTKESLQKNKIMKQLKDITTTDDKKRQLRKEYAKVTYENQKEILLLMEKLKDKNSETVKVKEESLEIMNELSKSKKKKKKEKKTEITLDDLNDEGYNLCNELSEKKLTDKEIKEKREIIHKEVIKEAGGDINIDNFKDVLKDTEMKMLFNLYDKYFFDNKLNELSGKNGCKWVVCWNNRCVKTAGLTKCKLDGSCKIISIELASQVFKNVIKKMISEKNDFITMDKKNKCDSILSCLMLTFEHELVHALQECFCPNWSRNNNGPGNWSGKKAAGSFHSKTFMSILNNIFGHIDYKHHLFSEADKKRKEEPEESDESDDGMGVGLDRFDKKKKEIPKEEPDPVEEEEEEEEEEPGRKGLGDELEEFQVNLIKGVTLAEQRNKGKRDKKDKKPKKLTKEGKKWVKGAIKDMKEREK